MKPIIVIGGGGHAKVLITLLEKIGCSITGIVDPLLPIASDHLGYKILGNDSTILKYDIDNVELINGIGSLPKDKGLRHTIYSSLTHQGYRFKTLIDPSALIASKTQLNAGVQVMAGVIIQAGTFIAENTLINTGAIIDHDCHIDQHVHIAPGATLSGGVKLGKYVHIGTGAIVIQGISIGECSIIGAGSVITQDVPARQIVYPARSCQKALNRE